MLGHDDLATAAAVSAAGLLVSAVPGITLLGRALIARPLSLLREAVTRFGHGALDVRVPELGPREVREVLVVFNEVAATLPRQRESQLQMLAAVVHDLRSPLGTIQTAADLLDDPSVQGASEVSRLTSVITRQVGRMNRLAGDLLDVARAEAGALDLRLRTHDLSALVSEAVEVHRQASRGRDIALSLPSAPLALPCDEQRILQVLDNLIGNALKYSPGGAEVGVAVESDGVDAVIEVVDRGLGIPADELERIFDPFCRSRATRDAIPGTGLGLSIARHIVAAHGGRMEVTSAPGEGSMFRVRLPLEKVAAAERRPRVVA